VRCGFVRTLLFALCAFGASATVLTSAASAAGGVSWQVAEAAASRDSLRIAETTEGGLGSFSFIVDPTGGDPTLVSARTTHAGVPAQAGPEENLALLVTTRYTITELLPGNRSGDWVLVGDECGGVPRKVHYLDGSPYISLRIVYGANTVCRFTNRLERKSRTVRSVTARSGA
jgi:hypothetical protein